MGEIEGTRHVLCQWCCVVASQWCVCGAQAHYESVIAEFLGPDEGTCASVHYAEREPSRRRRREARAAALATACSRLLQAGGRGAMWHVEVSAMWEEYEVALNELDQYCSFVCEECSTRTTQVCISRCECTRRCNYCGRQQPVREWRVRHGPDMCICPVPRVLESAFYDTQASAKQHFGI